MSISLRSITMALPLLLLVLSSCEKEEKPYTLPPPGTAKVQKVSMGEDYSKVIYFDLTTDQSFTRLVTDWDLGFESGDEGIHLTMNGGVGVQVYNAGSTDFAATYTVDDTKWVWDRPSGNLDSTAFGTWCNPDKTSKQEVYILDRGEQHKTGRYKKLQLLTVDASSYSFKYADLNSANEKTVTITKETDRNFSYFNFSTGLQTPLYEPINTDWDMKFIRYRFVYYDMTPITPYMVNGVLLNPNNVEVAKESTIPFDQIDFATASGFTYTKRQDLIGFDWKYYSFDASSYVTRQNITYVVKSHTGVFYKIRFVDFYDPDTGLRGTPIFETQRL